MSMKDTVLAKIDPNFTTLYEYRLFNGLPGIAVSQIQFIFEVRVLDARWAGLHTCDQIR